jgi:hypothetical protein
MSNGCGCHETYGAHLRSKNIHVGYCQSARNLDASAEKAKEKELAFYKDARNQGIQPASTNTKDTRDALDLSDLAGRAYDAGTFGFKA